jgi:hypothetical protein
MRTLLSKREVMFNRIGAAVAAVAFVVLGLQSTNVPIGGRFVWSVMGFTMAVLIGRFVCKPTKERLTTATAAVASWSTLRGLAFLPRTLSGVATYTILAIVSLGYYQVVRHQLKTKEEFEEEEY